MRVCHSVSFLRLAAWAAVGIAIRMGGGEAHAHISYTGRDFGAWSQTNGVFGVTGNSGTATAGSVTVTGTNLASSYGWADATDGDFGDSHRGRFFRLTLNDAGRVTVAVTGGGVGSVAWSGTGTQLLPGVSVYSGLAHIAPAQLDHDTSATSLAYLAATYPNGSGGSTKEGAFNALGNWAIGNDNALDVNGNVVTPGSLKSFTYIGNVADGTSGNYGSAAGINGDGTADGFVTGTFDLAAGDYTIFIGGANYSAQSTENNVSPPSYGFSTTLTVAPVPEPGTYALAVIGIAGACWLRRGRRMPSHA